MAGSILSTCAFIVASACSNWETGKANLPVMFIAYGILGGIGFSLIYVPAVITVGFYFDSKRALATGVAICGSGYNSRITFTENKVNLFLNCLLRCGTFLYAPLSAYLIEQFQWNGALLIHASLLFTCLIFASLYRPLKPPRKSDSGKTFSIRLVQLFS